MSLTITGSWPLDTPSPWGEAYTQGRNDHTALGTLLGLYKEVSMRQAGTAGGWGGSRTSVASK